MPAVPVDNRSVPLSGGGTPYLSPNTPQAAEIVGQAASAFGTSLNQAGDALAKHHEMLDALSNKAAADQAFASFATSAQKVAVDYTTNKMGVNAMPSLPDYMRQLHDARDAGGQGLSPMARSSYDSDTRRLLSNVEGELARHAATQQNAYVKGSSAAKVDAAQQLMVGQPGNEDTFNQAMDTIAKETSFTGRLEGGDDAMIAQATTAAQSKAIGDTVHALAQTDPIGAEQFYNRYRDRMTPKDIAAVGGYVTKAALPQKVASIVDDAIADVLGGGHGQTGTQAVPGVRGKGAPPPEYVNEIKVDPSGTFGSILGVPSNAVTITSAERSAAHNAAIPGASGTSEHLASNFNAGYGAWDISVRGMSNQQVVRKLVAEGVPADQIIDEGNHVHVGFGPQTRGMVGHSASPTDHITWDNIGPTNSAGVAGPTNLASMNSVDIKALAPRIIDAAVARAKAAFPNEPAAWDTAEQRAMSQISRYAGAATDRETSTYDGLLRQVVEGNVTDKSQLPPGALASLPARYTTALDSAMRSNANDWTVQRQMNYGQLTGEAAAARNGLDDSFLNRDIGTMDLPPAAQRQFIKEQQDLKAKREHLVDTNSALSRALRSPQFNANMSALGITKKDTPEKYFQYLGALQTEISSFEQAHGNRVPSDTDIAQIMTRLGTRGMEHTEYLGGLFRGKSAPTGPAAFEVPKEEHDKITAAAKAQGVTLSEQDIGRIYRRAQNGQP